MVIGRSTANPEGLIDSMGGTDVFWAVACRLSSDDSSGKMLSSYYKSNNDPLL